MAENIRHGLKKPTILTSGVNIFELYARISPQYLNENILALLSGAQVGSNH